MKLGSAVEFIMLLWWTVGIWIAAASFVAVQVFSTTPLVWGERVFLGIATAVAVGLAAGGTVRLVRRVQVIRSSNRP